MISNLYFQVASFVYIILLIVIYFSKKRINSLETKIFSILIITSFVGVILDLSSTYLAYINVKNIFVTPLCKLYLIYLLVFMFLLGIYILLVTSSKKVNKKIVYAYSILNAVFALGVALFPLYNYSGSGMIYTYGPSANLVYVSVVLNMFIFLLFIVFNFKNVKIKKYYPIFAFILLIMIGAVIQNIYPEILLVTFIGCFVTFLMYFTIENPDLKMINELNVARDQAEKANNAKSDFLSNMSHEIRTPLNAIVGFSQALTEEELPVEAKEEVADIIMASQNLLEIVNGILDISKIEANKLEIINTEYSFKKIVNDLVALTKSRLGEKPLDFRVSYDESIPPVLYGDHTRLKQIILNLLTNSVKYTKEGYLELKVNCVVKDSVCRLIISVEDSGIGIKNENIDKLFSKFERFDLEKNITIEGTGLGLAITKKLVDLMGGQIVVQSIYGQGSRFTIAIDQKIVFTPATVVQTIDDSNDIMNVSGKKILVVDDNLVNLKVVARLLSGYNLDLEEIQSGFECIDKIMAGSTYDLILLDDMMPKMSGVETLHKLKQIAGFNIPVVVLTANAISGMREKYLNEGFNDYLSKPIEKPELNRVIKKFMDKK